MAQSTSHRAGGCRCGAVRYTAGREPIWAAHCHCESCRRATGAPIVTWAGYRDEGFAVVRGAAKAYSSSPGVTRTFCEACGSPLTYQSERWPGETHVLAVTFDDPDWVQPEAHVFYVERLPWIAMEDDLPRYKTTTSGPKIAP